MTTRRRAANSEVPDQATSQRPDPVSIPPPPVETPSPPATAVTQDQFAALAQQVQVLTQLIGSHAAFRPAAPAPPPQEEPAAPFPPASSFAGSHGVAGPPPLRPPRGAGPAPQAPGRVSPPKSRRTRPHSPVSSRRDSSLPAPRPAPPSVHDEEIRQQIREMRRELDAAKQAHPPQPKTEQGKLSPNWEGPYQVTEVIGPGTYKLQDLDGKSIPRTWSSDNLRVYHP